MSCFKSRLRNEWSDDMRTALLLEPLVYESDELGRTITVPAGFPTDFASTRRWMWVIYPPTGRYGEPAVVHDFLYRSGKDDRKSADLVFYEAMRVKGVRPTQALVFYLAVRCGGWSPWNRYRNEET